MQKKLFFWDDVSLLDYIIPLLKIDQIIVTSTDTVPGLLAQVSQKTFDKLNQIKNRADKPYLFLIKSSQETYRFARMNPKLQVEKLMDACWPGPLTLIFTARSDAPTYIKGPQGTVAMRVPNHEGLQKILQHVDALFSTSANISGQPVPAAMNELDAEIVDHVACLIDDAGQKKIQSQPSTILDCTGDTIRVVREGAYPIASLEKIYGSQFS